MATTTTPKHTDQMEQMNVNPDGVRNNPTNKPKQTQTATQEEKGPEGIRSDIVKYSYSTKSLYNQFYFIFIIKNHVHVSL